MSFRTYDDWKLRSDRDDDWWNEPEPDVVSSEVKHTMEGQPMPDLADFADELAALIQEMLDAGVDRDAIMVTLDEKLKEMETETAGAEEPGEAPEDGEEPVT